MEDDLFRMFKYINMDPTNMMANMLRSFEQAMWSELRRLADERLEELLSQQKAQGERRVGAGVDESMNPFTILGVDFEASEEEVKEAYKKKAWSAHPDRGGSNEEMVKVNAAMEVVCRFKGWKR